MPNKEAVKVPTFTIMFLQADVSTFYIQFISFSVIQLFILFVDPSSIYEVIHLCTDECQSQ